MNVIDTTTFANNAKQAALETSFMQVAATVFGGHAVDVADPLRKFTVEILIDGTILQTTRADLPALSGAGEVHGDGCHAFMVSLPTGAIEPGAIIEARIANLGIPVGDPIAIDVDRPPTLEQHNRGSLSWLGGLRFSVVITGRDLTTIDVLVDGQAVLQARPTGWTSVDERGENVAARTFAFHLPERFADGGLHRVTVRDDQGELIGTGPLPFAAFADGLAAAIETLGGAEDERPRAELFDRLLPTSWPMARYAEWRDRRSVATLPARPEKIAVILTGAGSPDETVESLESQTGARWVAAALPDTGDAFGFAPKLMKDFLAGEGDDCPIVVLAPSGTRFVPDALQRLRSGFDTSTETFAVYGDLEVLGDDGTPWPLFLPAFDYERMLEQGYCSLVFAMHRPQLEKALAAGATDLFRVFNAQLDAGNAGAGGIAHVPGAVATLPRFSTRAAGKTLAEAAVAHLRERDMTAEAVAGKGAGLLPSVRISRRPTPDANVAIVVITNGKGDLGACLAAILPEARKHDAEIIVADTRYGHARTAAALASQDGVAATVVTVDGPFNAARMANLAVRSTGRDHLCLMADDVMAMDDGWLAELLGRIADPCVGAVSPLAVGAAGLVRDAGVVLGPGLATAPAFADASASGDGYGGMLAVAHQMSALDMGCLLTWRGDYLAVGGMDEVQFAADFADVDYCLKLRAARRRIVITPHARIVRAGKPRRTTPDTTRHEGAALRALRARWGDVLAADPYYNPLLALDSLPYSALAWPARDDAARRAEAPVPMPIPPGF